MKKKIFDVIGWLSAVATAFGGIVVISETTTWGKYVFSTAVCILLAVWIISRFWKPVIKVKEKQTV